MQLSLPNTDTGYQPALASIHSLLFHGEGERVFKPPVLGNSVTLPRTVHTGICKVLDITTGSTGLSDKKREIVSWRKISPRRYEAAIIWVAAG